MIFFDKTRTIGQDANGKNVVWVSVYVDTAANLPPYNDYQSDGFILCMASEGRCIDTGDLYRLDSAGTWQISQAGTGTYTKAEIDTLLNAKQDVLTFDSTPTQNSTNPVTSGGIWTDQQQQDALQDEDRSALVELVDNGAKNIVKNDPTSTSSGITVSVSADGKLVINGSPGSSAQSVFCTCYLDAATYVLSGCPPGGGTINYQCELRTSAGAATGYADTGDTVTFTITSAGYYRYNVRIAAGYTATNLTIPAMICTSAAWKISQSFQPYRPSWQEMYDMILALQ